MTNEEKYKTTKEQNDAFINFCCHHKCTGCPLYSIYMNPDVDKNCREAWLKLETEEKVETMKIDCIDPIVLAEIDEYSKYMILNEEIFITTGMLKGLELMLKILRNNGCEFEKAREHIEWVIQFEKEILDIKMVKRQEMNQKIMSIKRDKMLRELK